MVSLNNIGRVSLGRKGLVSRRCIGGIVLRLERLMTGKIPYPVLNHGCELLSVGCDGMERGGRRRNLSKKKKTRAQKEEALFNT